MTDFINFGRPRRKVVIKKVEMAESTKAVLEEEMKINTEDLTDEQIMEAANASKKVVAKRTKKGVRVKQALKG